MARCIKEVRREMRWAAEMGKRAAYIEFIVFGLSFAAAKEACRILSEAYGESGATFECENVFGVSVMVRW